MFLRFNMVVGRLLLLLVWLLLLLLVWLLCQLMLLLKSPVLALQLLPLHILLMPPLLHSPAAPTSRLAPLTAFLDVVPLLDPAYASTADPAAVF
jgi:hypothetical protein